MNYYKKRCYAIILLLLTFSLGYSQAYYHQNTDKITINKLVKMNAILAQLLLANGAMIGSIDIAERSLKEQLEKEYDANKYDNKSEFITSAILKAAMSVGTSLAGYTFKKNKSPYFTANKEKYNNTILNNVSDLAFLVQLDNNTIRSADRQEIYRIRREIIRTYSKDERYQRSLILLAGVVFALENDATLLKVLKGVEIVL